MPSTVAFRDYLKYTGKAILITVILQERKKGPYLAMEKSVD